MAVEYEISSDVATIKGVAPNTQVARVVSLYSGQITYDDEAGSKFATATIDGKSQRVMLCIAVNGTVNYDDVPCLYSTVDGHRCLNIVAPTETGTPDDVPSVNETVVIDGKNVRAVRCVLINATPIYDGVSSTCTFVENGKTHTAQLVNEITGGGAIEVIVRGTSPLSLPNAIANSLEYLKAFGGTEQRNIPQPYTQVNYVTNTAQTAVDTGVMIDFAKNYEFEVECRAVSGSWYILQSRASSSGNITGIHGATSGSTITLVVGNVTVCTSAITRTVGNKLYVKATLNAGTATLYVKDETANTEDTQTGSYGTSQPNPTASVYLLGNAGGQYADVNSDIYMARIKENDTVVMDYVPCRQVATAGFYDKASGTFKTALAPANLSADGNTVPTPDTPMDIISNNGVLKARHQSGLPLGYTLLEYIGSTGTQYIDTEITNVQTGSVVEVTFQPGNYDGWHTVYGNKNGGSNWFAYTLNEAAQKNSYIYGTWYDIDYPITADKHTMRQESNKFYLDGTLVYTAAERTFTNDTNLLLFARMSSRVEYMFRGKIYAAKIWNGGIMVGNFIPARRNSDNVLGMYDLVSGQFFTNAGTGTFTAGAVVDDLEIYTDGTVETIEDTIGNTATAEMLLKVGNYEDVQEILSGNVTRNVGVKVLDGTETYSIFTSSGRTSVFLIHVSDTGGSGNGKPRHVVCTHFTDTDDFATSSLNNFVMFERGDSKLEFFARYDAYDNDPAGFKQWVTDQYANGTPVIVVYPLATPTTESVAGQTMQVQQGDNVVEITQASIDGLEIEAKYKKQA